MTVREYLVIWLRLAGPLIVIYVAGVAVADIIGGWVLTLAFAIAYIVAMLWLLRRATR